MTATEKWNVLVDHHNKHLNAEERTIQSIWEKVFAEIFGYSSLTGEIERQRSIQIGSTYRATADIIIVSDHEDLFVVELKRHDSPHTTKDEGQLLSYMKLLRSNLGILICNKIYVYTYDASKVDDEQEKVEIEFLADNPDGIKFIELFSKSAFHEEAVKEFVDQKIESSKNVERIKKELTPVLVVDLLKNYFTKKYCVAEFEQAIDRVNLIIVSKNEVPATPTEIKQLFSSAKMSYAENNAETPLTKPKAVALCSSSGLNIDGKITLATRNKTAPYFWANPSIAYLSENWWLLLNDYLKKELYVFNIPANSIKIDDMKCRNDKPSIIDLQIRCDDSSFEDSRSNIKFANWFVKTIKF